MSVYRICVLPYFINTDHSNLKTEVTKVFIDKHADKSNIVLFLWQMLGEMIWKQDFFWLMLSEILFLLFLGNGLKDHYYW